MAQVTIKPIAHAYWRQIKAGNRTFEAIPEESMKEQVIYLAKTDVINEEITKEEYFQYIGEEYSPLEEE